MNGREHIFWTLNTYSLAIFLNSAIHQFQKVNWIWDVTLFILLLVSILLNDFANYLGSRHRKRRGVAGRPGKNCIFPIKRNF
ncbi:MAG: hypothetical protein ACTSWN_09690 [Promethearchaeota archaeon]